LGIHVPKNGNRNQRFMLHFVQGKLSPANLRPIAPRVGGFLWMAMDFGGSHEVVSYCLDGIVK